MRIDIWQNARESADVLPNGLKVRKTDTNGKFNLSMWMPKALKPFAHYAFRTEDAREAYIAKAIVNFDEHQARKAQYRKQRATGDASLADPGAVFCYSWGYDQTNVDYFQVVTRSGLSVTLAKIGEEIVPNSEGFMCETVRPKVDGFLYRCAGCRDGENALCHAKHVPHEAKERFGCTCSDYRPERILCVKRLQFWQGEPMVRFSCGIGQLVKIVRFANAAPLAIGSHYQSHYA